MRNILKQQEIIPTHVHVHILGIAMLSGMQTHLSTYEAMRIAISYNYVMACGERIPLTPLQPCKADNSDVKHVFIVNMCLLVSLTLHLFRSDGRRTSH